MIIYYSVILLSILIAYRIEKKNNVLLLILLISMVSLLSGFRGILVGTDTQVYYRIFSNLLNGGNSSLEVGFVFISRHLLTSFGNVRLLFVVYALLINGLIIWRLWDYREKISFGFSFFIYITIFYPQSMNIMRQYIALAIVFWACRYIEKHQYIKYVVLVILAATIHFSSIVALFIAIPYYYSENKGITKKKILLTLLILGGSPLILYAISELYNEYSLYLEGESQNISLLIIFRVCVIILFWLCYFSRNTFMDSNKKNKEIRIIAIIYTVAIITSLIGGVYEYVGRIGTYYMIFEILLAAYVCRIEKKYWFKTIYVFLALYFWIYKTGILGESQIIPFELSIF